MEKYRYTPPVEQADPQNTGIDTPLEDVSYDELWNQEREMQHMDNVQHLHGVY